MKMDYVLESLQMHIIEGSKNNSIKRNLKIIKHVFNFKTYFLNYMRTPTLLFHLRSFEPLTKNGTFQQINPSLYYHHSQPYYTIDHLCSHCRGIVLLRYPTAGWKTLHANSSFDRHQAVFSFNDKPTNGVTTNRL